MRSSYPLRPMHSHSTAHSKKQRGVALFVVLIFILLSMLLALWAARTALFSEIVVGNDADYQRAFESAQALLQDAELDIRGERSDGSFCQKSDDDSKDVCRSGIGYQIPLESQDVGLLVANLNNATARCIKGLCAKRLGRQDFWNYDSAHTPTPAAADYEKGIDELSIPYYGARHGQFTGAIATQNNILAIQNVDSEATTADDNQKKGGWYWIEVLPYDDSSEFSNVVEASVENNSKLPLNLSPAVVYRITAVAYGLKPGSKVVLQETYARTTLKD